MWRSSVSGTLALVLLSCPYCFSEDQAPPQLTWEGKALAEHIAGFNDEDAGKRTSSANALGAIAILSQGTMRHLGKAVVADFPDAKTIWEPLLKACKDKDPVVRRMSISALGWAGRLFGQPDKDLLSQIVITLQEDKDASVRANAVNAYKRAVLWSKSLRSGADVSKVLENATKDPDPLVRRAVANAFLNFWMQKDHSGVPSKLIADKDELTAQRAKLAVGRIDGQHAQGWNGTTWDQAVEEFERDPLDLESAIRLLWVYSETHRNFTGAGNLPAAYCHAARMVYWLESTNSLPDSRSRPVLDWSWKYLPQEEQGEAIDDWLRGRLQVFDVSSTAQSAVELFRERGNRLQVHPDEIKELFQTGLVGNLPAGAHLKAALLLEKGGFDENARREFLRAAGQWAYFQNGFMPVKVASADVRAIRQNAITGLVRVLSRMGRWDEARSQLGNLEESAGKHALEVEVEAKRAFPVEKHKQPWKRIEWVWDPSDKQSLELQSAQTATAGILVSSLFDITLINSQTGSTQWRWDPGNGQVLRFGEKDGKLACFVNPLYQRPKNGDGGMISYRYDGDPNAAFPLYLIDQETGKGQKTATVMAHAIYPVSDSSLLVAADGSYRLEFPLGEKKDSLVLDGVSEKLDHFTSAGSSTLIFIRRGTLQLSVVDRLSGKVLWRTEDKAADMLPGDLADERFAGEDFDGTSVQAAPDLIYRGLITTLAAYELHSGKLLWKYCDPVLTATKDDCRTWVRSTGVFAAGGKTIICVVYPDAGIAVLDAKDGKFIWRLNLRAPYSLSGRVQGPFLAASELSKGKPALWVGFGKAILVLDPLTGHLIWSSPICSLDGKSPGRHNSLMPIVMNSRIVAFSSYDALSIRTEDRPKDVEESGAELWSKGQLLKVLSADPNSNAVSDLVNLGYGADPEVRTEILRKMATMRRSYYLLPTLAPFSDREFQELVVPVLAAQNRLEGETIDALNALGTPQQVKALADLKAKAKEVRKSERIGFHELRLRDAKILAPPEVKAKDDDF